MFEIERKYLVDKSKWNPAVTGEKILQGYLSTDKERVVRVRTKGEKAFLTIKGKMEGITRAEFEYEIPVDDALPMLKMCLNHPIEKTRYKELHHGKWWEIDVFEGENAGLILAEIELQSEEEQVQLPVWITEEVTHDLRFYNSYMSRNPYSRW
ncbi:CYTH domain-containing protein [Maribellus sp. YY47]|uniref:CYTH domain-containing protein n=1 Tax=Maribellus sp. YY47 TaxID=2929486 RepID=UPI002001B8F6|nr:CYTH domain-containing protein [Maribellus sp. YY47]MCK3684905.1 CYTH domain-containing protein [Maribellus sp. YY47]